MRCQNSNQLNRQDRCLVPSKAQNSEHADDSVLLLTGREIKEGSRSHPFYTPMYALQRLLKTARSRPAA